MAVTFDTLKTKFESGLLFYDKDEFKKQVWFDSNPFIGWIAVNGGSGSSSNETSSTKSR